ncbi:MAG: 4-(cytidine 5'-diphospho)-2-C-methyl-D-erythritol kinase [Nitrospiraceae bacterium]|nr:MAG: 4-(cytidine 5'-diphospho)-2-C-methyl-D-erythritol kinase [Nitrospiraceae bacterium]
MMLTIKAPAKINWFLHVLGLRDDGFHEIQSLMQKIALYDVLTFTPSKDLILETDASIPPEQNLVYKAAVLLRDTYGVGKGACVRLDKNIPVGAGLGGGSSDAAAALAGLSELWSLDITREELCGIAGQLGSDAPFFLCGPLSFAQGRGERLTPCMARKPAHLLLVKPPFPVSTAWVYKEFRNSKLKIQGHLPELTNKSGKVDNIEFLISSVERAGFRDAAEIISNDLESVTVRSFPVIAEIKKKLVREGAVFSLMSGSGSTVFGVFNSPEEAEDASRSFKGFWTAAVSTIID